MVEAWQGSGRSKKEDDDDEARAGRHRLFSPFRRRLGKRWLRLCSCFRFRSSSLFLH